MSPLWHEPAPRHFDALVPWWAKALLIAAASIAAICFVDSPVAAWTLRTHPFFDLADPAARHGDLAREFMMLEQWGQWVCSLMVIAAVALIDRAGPRRALAIAIGCLFIVLLSYLLKDLFGRCRPYVLGAGHWEWGGPRKGFSGGSRWGSFPSGHSTGAFALSVGLAWFYPRARALFMTLATITVIQRVLHSAHYVSDVIAGMGIAVLVTRWTFQARLAGRLIALLPPALRQWILRDTRPVP